MIESHKNPLLFDDSLIPVDSAEIEAPTILARTKRSAKREIRDVRRVKAAEEALAGLKPELEIVGFTKGQFSLLDCLKAIADITGPAFMTLSTWTANGPEIATLADMVQEGKLTGARFLIDASFARRDPQAAEMLRKRFGLKNVRVSQCHAKFATFKNATWSLVLRTSMNLNMNPRFEDFTVGHDPELYGFMTTIMDELFSRTKEGIKINLEERRAINRNFADNL